MPPFAQQLRDQGERDGRLAEPQVDEERAVRLLIEPLNRFVLIFVQIVFGADHLAVGALIPFVEGGRLIGVLRRGEAPVKLGGG